VDHVCRVVWVLKELEPENWIHNGGTDFAVQLKPPSAADVLGKVLTAEGTYSHWSLFNRFILANEILDAADSAGAYRACDLARPAEHVQHAMIAVNDSLWRVLDGECSIASGHCMGDVNKS